MVEQQEALKFCGQKMLFLVPCFRRHRSSRDRWEENRLREQRHGAQRGRYCRKEGRTDMLDRFALSGPVLRSDVNGCM